MAHLLIVEELVEWSEAVELLLGVGNHLVPVHGYQLRLD